MSRGFLVTVFVLVLAATAHGDAKQQAADLAAKSAQHYKRGEFEESARLLREAYARYPEPNLLYNLARSLEGLGDRQGAIDAYEQYLSTAKQIEDRPGIERRVATLKAELAEQKRRAAEAAKQGEVAPPAPEPTKIETPPEAAEPEAPPQPRNRLPAWVTIAGGAALVATGGVFGYLANQNHNRAVDAMTGVEAQSFQDTAHRDAIIANVLFGVGGAVVIAGVVWVW